MIKNRLIVARKERNKTQKEMADFLCISQSQYQRRESGEIRIFEDEWIRLADFLGKNVEEIKDEDFFTNIYNYDNHSGNYSASTNNFYSIPEFMMKNLQEYIEMLKQRNSDLNTEIVRLQNLLDK